MLLVTKQSHITVDQEAGAFSLIVLTKKNKKMYFFLFKYLSSALTKLISRARGIRPQVCAFPVLSVSVSFKLVLHWLWWAGFGGGKMLKLQHLSLISDLKGTLLLLHVKLRPGRPPFSVVPLSILFPNLCLRH